MKRVLSCLLAISLITILHACTTSSNTTTPPAPVQSVNTVTPEQIMQKYFAFIQKFDAAGVANMRIDVTTPDQNKANYRLIVSLLSEAEAIRNEMSGELAKNQDVKVQAQIKPYLPIMEARVAALTNNKAAFEAYGAF